MTDMPSPLIPPTLRDDLPRYPPLMQDVRVTSGTVPGPSGYTSTSIQAANLYVAFTQQLRSKSDSATVDNSLFPRDREPCFVLDVNGLGLVPGYYTNARLSGSWQSLPVYAVGDFPVSFAGLTSLVGSSSIATNVLPILTNALNVQQLATLYNLTPCQITTLVENNAKFPVGQQMQPDIPRLQTLTLNLTQTQLSVLTQYLTATQLTLLTSTLTLTQIQQVSQIFTGPQLAMLVQILTPQQIQNLLLNLPTAQLQLLVQFDPAIIVNLIQQPFAFIQALLNVAIIPGGPLLGNQFWFPQIPVVNQAPTQAPNTTNGYGTVVADNSGNIYVYASGAWNKVPAGSGSGASNTLTTYSGSSTTPGSVAVNITNTSGLHGSVSLYNTHATFGLTYTPNYTDMNGNSNNGAPVILGAQTNATVPLEPLQATGSGATSSVAPIKTFTLTIADQSNPNHATFKGWISRVG